jgi:hypothetical protein
MNIEMFFIQSESHEAVIDAIRQRIKSPADAAGMQPDWGLQSSYDVLIARDRKRKVAVSPVVNGWIAAIESKEVLDFAMLQWLSELLKAKVLAVQVSEATGAAGYAALANGTVLASYFSEEDENPLGTTRDFMARDGVPLGLISFREAVQLRGQGWSIVQ